MVEFNFCYILGQVRPLYSPSLTSCSATCSGFQFFKIIKLMLHILGKKKGESLFSASANLAFCRKKYL